MVGFEQAEYTALENDEFVDVCVTLTCPANQTDVVIVVFSKDDNIVDGHLIASELQYIHENIREPQLPRLRTAFKA